MGFDEYTGINSGLLINKSGPSNEDGGDSAQMTGLYRFGRWMKFRKDADMLAREQAKFAQELDTLTYTEGHGGIDMTGVKHDQISYPGIYVRHPKPCYPGWAADPHCFSRDQQRSLVVAMGALKQKKQLKYIFWKHIKRLGWYQNDMEIDGKKKLADFAAPDILGEYIRAFWMSSGTIVRGLLGILYPVLIVTDIVALIGLLMCFYKWRNPDEADDDNLILTVLQAKNALPTPISWVCRKIYKRFRPVCPGADEKLNGPISAMSWKHRYTTGSPPFIELYYNILKEEL